MRMELIQPFVNSAAAVLGQSLGCEARIADVSMEEEAYRRRGLAALVSITGDIEGRVIFDVDPATATKVASFLAGCEIESSDELVRETVYELANMVIGNAVTALNDEGIRFHIHPPQLHADEKGFSSSEDTEALLLCFETESGSLYMNIAMRYQRRRHDDKSA